MNQEIRDKLISMSENKYKIFSSALIPNSGKMLGIRIPILRNYAKQLSSTIEAESLNFDDDVYYEEIMLKAILIGTMKFSAEERLEYIRNFIPKINNWAVCDSFCVSLKFTRKNQKAVWNFLKYYCDSKEEFFQRFAEVMMLNYFVNEEYIEMTLQRLTKISVKEFYSSMGAAWAIAECYIKFPQKTEYVLKQKILDNQTHNKAIRKICDSYRVSKSDKDYLKTLLQ